MGLSVNLVLKGEEVFSSNITHNLAGMAIACGVYHACWNPKDINCKRAKHILPMLRSGSKLLEEHREFYKTFNAQNGWGLREHLIEFLEEYATACEGYPEAKISVYR